MKNLKGTFLAVIFSTIIFISCGEKKTDVINKESDNKQIKDTTIMTKEKQQALTPDKVLEILKEGNQRFVNGKQTFRDINKQMIAAVKGQYPMAVVLSCIDSRVPVELVFDLSIGDIFVARVAGNIVNPDILGSMGYGCKVSGAKLILVVGHEGCGAVKAAIEGEKLGNITGLLDKIKPAINSLKSFTGNKTPDNKEYVQKVCDKNVSLTIDNIRRNSPVLKEMESKGEIKIIGGVYGLEDGKVKFLEEKK